MAISTRLRALSLRIRAARWVLTVLMLMCSSSVISLLVRPRATGSRISSSRTVRGSRGCAGGVASWECANLARCRTVMMGGLDPVEVGRADVEQAHVGSQPTSERDGVEAVGGLTDHLDVQLGVENHREARSRMPIKPNPDGAGCAATGAGQNCWPPPGRSAVRQRGESHVRGHVSSRGCVVSSERAGLRRPVAASRPPVAEWMGPCHAGVARWSASGGRTWSGSMSTG